MIENECEKGFRREGGYLKASREPNMQYTDKSNGATFVWVTNYKDTSELKKFRYSSIKQYIIGTDLDKDLNTTSIKSDICRYLK